MNLKKLVTVASLILAVGAFAPAIFAQVGGVTRVTGGSNVVPESPSNGQPGTEMPASAAPVGAGEAAYMSHENVRHRSEAPSSLHTEIKEEEQANRMEVMLERQIDAARARGGDVAAAQRERGLGSISLRKGRRREALSYFANAERDLNNQRLSDNSIQNSRLRVKETDQTPNAVNMHPNSSASTTY
jgi:hypothetical protein